MLEKLQVFVPPDMARQLRHYAKVDERTVSQVVVRLLRAQLGGEQLDLLGGKLKERTKK